MIASHRAYIVQEQDAPDASRAVFVSVDMGMIGQLLKKEVLDDLEELFPGEKSQV